MHRWHEKHPVNLPPEAGGGQIRIIAGDWRGRKLPVADLPGLRPTSDRVRETVFNWLAPYIPGARVLDCFSGTGALSLEALSRGAKEAVMLEMATPAVKTLKSNLSLLKADNGQVMGTNTLQFLSKPCPEPFDVIFLDPPFRQGMLEETCRLLQDNGYLHEQTILYIEVEKELDPLPVPQGWQLLKSKQAGQVSFNLLSG
ncbi:16S rRNA (guanine(966)-N(2))-methyltransferase RsmD [Endozoicomonas sp. NE40]|uniref:Ribosomal RNA small subunit methyltransferase D n=1 Tax=Endozoicomonas lisbonensis TaxID=3120522 RepID=A0ABV2SG27_9GAMM